MCTYCAAAAVIPNLVPAQDGCDEIENFAEASTEVERLREAGDPRAARARRATTTHEFLASGQAAAGLKWGEATDGAGGRSGEDDSGGDHTDDDGDPRARSTRQRLLACVLVSLVVSPPRQAGGWGLNTSSPYILGIYFPADRR